MYAAYHPYVAVLSMTGVTAARADFASFISTFPPESGILYDDIYLTAFSFGTTSGQNGVSSVVEVRAKFTPSYYSDLAGKSITEVRKESIFAEKTFSFSKTTDYINPPSDPVSPKCRFDSSIFDCVIDNP